MLKTPIFRCVATAILFTIMIGGCSSTSQPSDKSFPDEDVVDRPPLVFVNDTLYKYSKEVTSGEMDDNFIYIGDIESSVPSSQSPSENFQANDDIIGAEIYQSDDNIIVVYNEQYNLYIKLE